MSFKLKKKETEQLQKENLENMEKENILEAPQETEGITEIEKLKTELNIMKSRELLQTQGAFHLEILSQMEDLNQTLKGIGNILTDIGKVLDEKLE